MLTFAIPMFVPFTTHQYTNLVQRHPILFKLHAFTVIISKYTQLLLLLLLLCTLGALSV